LQKKSFTAKDAGDAEEGDEASPRIAKNPKEFNFQGRKDNAKSGFRIRSRSIVRVPPDGRILSMDTRSMGSSVPTLHEDGYAVASAVLDKEQTASIQREMEGVTVAGAGTRNLLELSWCRELVERIRTHPKIRPSLPSSPVAVQCTFFDKTEDRNWLVAIHQDLSISVKERIENPDLRLWSLKEGAPFVQGPVDLLEQLLAVRVHIDDCGPENGPLRVVPRSHRHGRLDESAARRLRDTKGEMTCAVTCGDALLLRPLILHASSKAKSPHRRRVLHFLFGPEVIGYGLKWAHAV
jgi:hypothetical protein